jgi:hypothetical protein
VPSAWNQFLALRQKNWLPVKLLIARINGLSNDFFSQRIKNRHAIEKIAILKIPWNSSSRENRLSTSPYRIIFPAIISANLCLPPNTIRDWSLPTDVCNTNLTNIIRQLACVAGHAEEILGEQAQELWVRNDRIRQMAVRVETLSQKVKSLNPKTSGKDSRIA